MRRLTFVPVIFTILLLISAAAAQDNDTHPLGAPACGDPNTHFNVKTETGPHPTQLESGKALLYFIQDDSEYGTRPRPTTRMGVDGKWAGATHGDSYFYIFVDPGIHHLCANWQSILDSRIAAAHFTAETGGVYYFAAIDLGGRGVGSNLTLTPLDSDEGQLLIGKLSFAKSQPKK